jgi:hypothetical protein
MRRPEGTRLRMKEEAAAEQGSQTNYKQTVFHLCKNPEFDPLENDPIPVKNSFATINRQPPKPHHNHQRNQNREVEGVTVTAPSIVVFSVRT